MRLWLLIALLAWPCLAEAPRGFSLVEAVVRMRSSYPAAEVTGRFSDWRTPSIYRSHGGLHYGYDIGMPAGSVVPAVWPGVVVAVTPWTDTQVGITVQTADMEVTYGHLVGCVKAGTVVRPGDPLGVVAVDHVDIKMRDASGAYYDFGTERALDPADLAEERARAAAEQLTSLQERLASLNFQLNSLKRERDLLRKERLRLGRMVPQLGQLVSDGAMAAADEGRLPLRLHFVATRLKELEQRGPAVAKQKLQLQAELWLAERTCKQLVQEAARLGRKVKPDECEAPAVASQGPQKAGGRLEELLKYGILSRKEYEDALRRQRWDAAAGKAAVGAPPAGGQGPP